MPEILIPVAAGELIDKITILEIKEERVSDPDKLVHIKNELASLRKVATEHLAQNVELENLHQKLKSINTSIWESEDGARALKHDLQGNKDAYLAQTYNSHEMNEARFAVKKAINELCKSSIQEQKNYI